LTVEAFAYADQMTARAAVEPTYRPLRWLGPPRLRIVVPDSRSMLWIEPYERPVDATKVRMLAPLSYALRSSLSI
jgi:hypothetical protein